MNTTNPASGSGALAPHPTLPSPGQPPAGYVEFSTCTMNSLIEGSGSVTWTCWVRESDDQGRKRRARTTAWLVAQVGSGGGALDVDLHAIGAQHRSHTVLVRTIPADATTQLFKTEENRVPIPPPNQKAMKAGPTGFYQIDPSDPQLSAKEAKVTFLNRYSLRSTGSKATIEVFFDKHPPGTFVRQLEDGGPPPIPPIGFER